MYVLFCIARELQSSLNPVVCSAIIDQGGIEYFVNITRMERGKLRSMAVEALRVLSEDLSPSRQTRAELCYHGAAEALGLALSDGIESSRKQPSNVGMPSLIDLGQLKDIHESLSALANVLDPLPEGVSVGYHLKSDGRDIHKLLLEGCRQTTSSGGLSALLFIASLRFIPIEGAQLENIHIDTMFLLEEACRSLASVSPLLLSRQLAASGYAKWTDDVLISLGMVANQLERCENRAENLEDSILEIQVNVLRCLGALARYEPLKTRIVDRLLPFLLKMSTARDGGESSNAANQTFQALGLSDDEIAVQVSGNNAQLLADWFCLKRSCEIQAMARDEIRMLLKNIWREPLRECGGSVATTQLNRVGSERSDVSSGTCSDLFEIALNESEPSSSKALEDIIRQYQEVYGSSEPRPKLDAEAGSESLLVEQSFPMDSTDNERKWILAHESVLRETGATLVRPAPHVGELLRRMFPSTLIRDRVAPWNNLRPKSSFQFRGFMMPKRRYFSFRREGQLLSRLCQMESALCESSDVHWTLGFLNSSFAGEFSESLVQALYMCPMIIGLSFSQTGAVAGADDPEVNVDDGGSAMVSSLVGSLPPWIFSLTFDGLLNDRVMKSLVKVLETMGRLTAGHTDQLGSISHSSRSKNDQSQGRFSFLAVRRSPKIQKDSWKSFFRLLGHTEIVSSKSAPRPLSTLKVLDLSGNRLGDDLCAAVLLLAHDKDSGCTLEEVDLSGNCIGDASSVLKVLREYVNQHRYQQHTGRATTKKRWKSHLHTLVLADNDLHTGRAWLEFLYMLKNDALELQVLDISNNGLVLGDHEDDLCDAAVSALLKSTSLRRLNLSKNAFSQRSLDQLLQALALATNDSVLSFLDIEGNVPSLSEQQKSLLASFLSRTRKNLVQRSLNSHKEVEVLSDSSAEIASPSLMVAVQAEESVDALTSNASSSKQGKPELWENMITVLFSAPLVFFNDREIATPFEKLDFAMEREILWQCLKEASREIDLFFDNATADRLLTAISKRCTCLHYSGTYHMFFGRWH
jgi:Leucine Rich repeat